MSSNDIPRKDRTHTENHVRHRLRTHRRFRLSFINENTFNEVWTIRMSQRKVVACIILIFVAVGCMAATLIVFTPLRTLLPGYLKQEERQENTINLFRIDSLLTSARTTSGYLSSLGTILRSDTIATIASESNRMAVMDHAVSPDSLMPASEAEKALVHRVEERKRYTLDKRAPSSGRSALFHLPVSGGRLTAAPPSTSVSIAAPRNSAVTAPASGSIVDRSYSPEDAWTVIIQHPDGYVTRIGGISETTIERGKNVTAGETIGLTDTISDITVEMWNAGVKIDPLRFMTP
ncbi:M23 family metallopeptidase [uncultured Muribaculum sp.]|uniref:M23 family metallopeptidase n=1 Tax=uncultured Muribaculum sp. TaxID=1918613 RepID=UPI0025CE699B|nr:M23 family metallopeptidase [uncultured Muribaculum sp.]